MSRFCRIQNSGVQIAFVQAGISDGNRTPGILSLGTVYNQPYWIFYSSPEPLDRLSQLKGKRIAVGPQGSGTRLSAEKILGKGGVNSETATLLPFAGLAAVKALSDKKVDVVWIIGSPDATAVKSFLGNPDVRLLAGQGRPAAHVLDTGGEMDHKFSSRVEPVDFESAAKLANSRGDDLHPQ
jgi:TRAP-type uncharacterized transport system substrate-binding protein